MEALQIWRLYPTQIESDLAIYCRRSVGEWHRGEMSSRELLALLSGLPEVSKFKEASQRWFRLVEYVGPGELRGKLFRIPGAGRLPRDTELIAEYVDWTHEQKVAARNARELASMRADGRDYQPDLTGLIEPLQAILSERRLRADDKMRERAQSRIHAGLYGYENEGR